MMDSIILSPSHPSTGNGHLHHHHRLESKNHFHQGESIVSSSKNIEALDHHYTNLLFKTGTSHYQKLASQTGGPSLSQSSSSSSSSSGYSSSSSQLSSSQSSSQLSSSQSSSQSSPSSSQSSTKRFTPKACSSNQLQHSPSTNNKAISKLNEAIKCRSKCKRQENCNHKKIPFTSENFSPDDGTESDAENYERISQIGEGTYGVVFKARDLRSTRHNSGGAESRDGTTSNVYTNEVVAMKRVTVPLYEEEGIPVTLLREISLLKSLENYSHPNIVRLLDICTGKRLRKESFYLYLIFEHVEQDLASYLANCPPPGLCPSRIKEVAYFILKGIDFLHSNRIVHRDLKPSNVLVSKDGQIKLADFGLARIYESSVSLTTTVVTLWYRSPEVLLCTSYASSIDIWSIGCIFAELFTRKALITGNSEADQLSKIFQLIGSPKREEWPSDCSIKYEIVSNFKPTPIEVLVPNICSQGKELLMKMLTFNPKERISGKDALLSDYFNEYANHPPFYDQTDFTFESEMETKRKNVSKCRRRFAHDQNMDP